MPAAGQVEHVDAGLRGEDGKRPALPARSGAGYERVRPIAQKDGIVVAHGPPHGGDDLERETAAVFKAPAVFVLPGVRERGQKLADEIPRRAGDLHRVEPGLPCPPRPLGPRVHDGVQLLDRHGAGGLTGEWRVHGGRRDRPPPVRDGGLTHIAAGVVELHGDRAVTRSHPGREHTPRGDALVPGEIHRADDRALPVEPARPDDDKPRTALGTPPVELVEPRRGQAVFGVERVHSGHQDAVFHREPPNGERPAQIR